MAAATSHEVESSVIAVQLTRQYVIDVLRTAGLPEMADEALHELPDPELVSMWAIFQDNVGVSLPEVRKDYNRFDDPVFVPQGWTGTNAQGATINSSSTFISIRPKYLLDPNWPKVQAYLNDPNNPNAAPSFTYHRFWAQADIALAMAEFGRLFP